jgi:hypothetical protein
VANRDLTIRERSESLSLWFVFVGSNVIAVMTYFILWVEDRRKLPIILAVLPMQVVADAFLVQWRGNWPRIRLADWLTTAVLGWFLWACIHNGEWYLLPAVAFGFAMLIWRFQRIRKRNA